MNYNMCDNWGRTGIDVVQGDIGGTQRLIEWPLKNSITSLTDEVSYAMAA